MHHYIPFSCDENSKYGNFEFQGPSHNSAPWPCLCEIECMPANVTKWSVCAWGSPEREPMGLPWLSSG